MVFLAGAAVLSMHGTPQAATLGVNAVAERCSNGFMRSSIAGEGNRVRLSLGGRGSGCRSASVRDIGLEPQPYATYEVACSADRLAAVEGLCSTTPCPEFGRFFAFRTIHQPDGSSQPGGFGCVRLDQASAAPGVTLAQVYAAIRTVKLPGGHIGAAPALRGLANLPSFFWVHDARQPPVDLRVAGATVHAEFQVLEYHWRLGGRRLVTGGPGRPGPGGPVQAAFERRGVYRVGVQLVWNAQAWLEGRPVGQVQGLVSQTQTSYPVAELHTTLTG